MQMNQGILNCNGNYGPFFFPSGQTIYMVSQPQQIGLNQAYNIYNQFPINQHWVYPQIQTSLPQIPQSNENSDWNNKHYENTNNNITTNDKNQIFQNEQSQVSQNVKELKREDYSDQEIQNGCKVNKSKICFIRTNKLEGQETSYFGSESSQDNESIKASSYNNLNKKNLQIDYLRKSNIKCIGKIVTDRSVSINNTILKPLKIKRKIYPKAEDFTKSLQAGYRFINKCGEDHAIEIIKTISSFKQIQQFEIQKQGEYNQNTNLDTYHHKTFINLNVQHTQKDNDFYQLNVSPKETRKEKKIAEKQLEKQQLNCLQLEQEYRSILKGQEQNLNHLISEKEGRSYQSYSGYIPITEGIYKNSIKKCIYELIERQRTEMISQVRNENDMAQILIDKLNTSYRLQNHKFQDQNQSIKDYGQKIKIEAYDKNDRTIISDYDRCNVKIQNQDQEHLQSSKKDDYIILLQGKNREQDLDLQKSKLLKKLKNKAQSLLQGEQIKESLFLKQSLQNSKYFNDQNGNILENSKQTQLKQDFDSYDSTIHTLVLCEKLMESTQTHKKIFEFINQTYLAKNNDEKEDSNLKKLQNPSSLHIPSNTLHSSQREDINLKSNKNQQNKSEQQNNDQIENCSSVSTSSQERISSPEKVRFESPLNQEFNFIQFSVKNPNLFEKFDFSQVRQITQKYRSARKHKLNSTYKANSKYHNMNKLLMYNIMSMFQMENLVSINLDENLISHLAQIVKVLKLLSKRSSEKYKFEYFSREHYHILFLKITPHNQEFLCNSEKDRFLHEKCYNIDFSKPVSPVELNYINIIKNLFFQIFLKLIQHDKIVDDGTNTKPNLRRQYCLKAISGIKKLSLGEVLVRF